MRKGGVFAIVRADLGCGHQRAWYNIVVSTKSKQLFKCDIYACLFSHVNALLLENSLWKSENTVNTAADLTACLMLLNYLFTVPLLLLGE